MLSVINVTFVHCLLYVYHLMIDAYYEWRADDRLCTLLETPGAIRTGYDVIF